MSNETKSPSTFLAPQNAQDAFMIASELAKSSMIPKAMIGKPSDIVVCMAYGAELGLQPLQSLQNIAVINGRPSLWGDAVRALVLNSHDLVELKEWNEGGTFFCEIKRKTRNGAQITITQSFGDDDAKKAGLLGKQGPWSQYPDRMKQMRAFSFSARDAYADRLRGFITREEAADIPADTQGQPERDVTPQEAKPDADKLLEQMEAAEAPQNDGQVFVDLLARYHEADKIEDLAVIGADVTAKSSELKDSQLSELREKARATKRRLLNPAPVVEFDD